MRPPAAGVQVPDLPLALSRGRQGVLEVGESPVDGPGAVGSLELEFLGDGAVQLRCGDRGERAEFAVGVADPARVSHGIPLHPQLQELRTSRKNVTWFTSIILRQAVLKEELSPVREVSEVDHNLHALSRGDLEALDVPYRRGQQSPLGRDLVHRESLTAG